MSWKCESELVSEGDNKMQNFTRFLKFDICTRDDWVHHIPKNEEFHLKQIVLCQL